MTIADYSKNSYFAAANSRDGFVSFFDDIFSQNELDYLYIIKGGSGTGKSRLMKEIADEAIKRGESVEYFYCSSDPKSLDGVILCERRVGIIDGTAPHVCEPRLPGCFDEILNLGAFWDNSKLKSRKSEISELCKKKSVLYSQAYSYLSVAGKLTSMCDSILSQSVKKDKLYAWGERLCKRYLPSTSYREKTRLTDGISSLGRVHIDSFYSASDERFIICDTVGISHMIFSTLKNSAKERGISTYTSYDPLDTKKINALYFADTKTSFTLANEESNIPAQAYINTERFFERDSYRNNRQRVRFMNKCANTMCDAAIETMKTITKLHMDVENIYISAMDFDGKEKYTRTLAAKIFK